MRIVLPPSNLNEPITSELYLRMDKVVFGVSFTDLTAAREAARQINLTGRGVEIYEKVSGSVLESSAGVAASPLKPL